MQSGKAPAPEDAVHRAHEVVGLYGDPETTWGICLELTFEDPLDLSGVDAGLDDLVRRFPHLGERPLLHRASGTEWAQVRERHAALPFGDDGRLVRLLLSEDGRTLFVAAHHGVVDGLGMLAVAESVCRRRLGFAARGIGDRTAPTAFWRSSVTRLLEAVFSPPARFGGTESRPTGEEVLGQTTMPRARVNAAVMVHAVACVHRRWPRRRNSGGRRFLVIMGASRREPGEARAADRQTGYVRVAVDAGASLEETRRVLAATEPEPEFPETSAGGVGPAVTKLLRNRLGATTTIANLGVVSGEGLVSGAIFPALSGPRACGIGLLSTDRTTTISLRTRRSDFSAEEAVRLLELVVEEVAAAAGA